MLRQQVRHAHESVRSRGMTPVILLAALSGCVQMPGAPTKADIERGLNTPIDVQPSLGGRITNALTAEPVVDALITVQGRSVASSRTGHYGFDPNLTPGVFLVRVTHPLYTEREREVEIKPHAIADFALQPK